jgi:hypothetical protein
MSEYAFLQHKVTGQIWRAGHTVYGLCAAWNHATNPALPMTDQEHKRSLQYARAIRRRMQRLGMSIGRHYRELSSGALWPIKDRD